MDRDKKIGIIYNGLNNYGGVQICVIELVKALNRQGFKPYLITDRTPNNKMINNENLDLQVKMVNYSIKKRTFNKYQKVLSPFREFLYYFKTSWLKNEFDFVYFFQFNIIVDDETDHLCYLSNSPITPYSPNPFIHRLKYNFYKLFVKPFLPVFEFQRYNAVINSEFTSEIFYKEYGKKLDVVYPPNSMATVEKAPETAKDACICLSRISPKKKNHLVLDLAQEFRDQYFYIIGGLAEEDIPYFESIQNSIEEEDIQNVEILANVEYPRVVDLLLKSEYYLFFGEFEHFGITTVEAIMNHCIPFVHNSGGQKEIVPLDDYRFDYSDMVDKFSRLIRKSAKDKGKDQMALLEHMENFTTEKFTNNLTKELVRSINGKS